MIRAINNTVLVRPNYEALTRTSRLHHMPGTVDTKEFGKVTVGTITTYRNDVIANNIAWGTVQSVGQGAAWMGGKHRMDRVLHEGDVIGFDAQKQISAEYSDSELYMLPVDAPLCVFNPGMERPKPLGVYVMTEEEEGAAARFMFSNPATAAQYHLTGDAKKGALKVSDWSHSKIKLTIERVVDVGAGGMSHSEIKTVVSRHWDQREEVRVDGETKGMRGIATKVLEKREEPVFIRPDPETIGLLAGFMPTMSVDMNFHGKRLRFTNYDRIRFVWDGT